MKSITKVLIANRGEIACRVIRTCREMGIRTAAVYSDADASMPFVRLADEAIHIGPAPSQESYLAVEKILAAAKRVSADAIHPGYGFLAENADFAKACADAGITFIGPSPEAIAKMGSKRAAKEIAVSAGVPVIPGYSGEDQSDATLIAEAKKIGFPVLVKASAGGGGKGMRIVRTESDLADAISGARREAESSFSDGTLLIERYVDGPRHVEIQILGDEHGNLVHLFERECSIQRRYQKIIEESPSPILSKELRKAMGDAAIAMGRAIGYSNAGTVEFIVGPEQGGKREFFFLEVNTRLQVEHPVTECVTGIDLVREQIRVARGETLGYAQDDLSISGAAVETRLYAEDPEGGFLPQSGRLVDFHVPKYAEVRVDTGVESGSEISIYYDPMIAKLITYGRDRAEALDRMRYALEETSLMGISTNRDLLLRILGDDAFRSGTFDTHFLAERSDLLEPASTSLDESTTTALVAAALHGHERRRAARTVHATIPTGFRNNVNRNQMVSFRLGEDEVSIGYRHQRKVGHFDVVVSDRSFRAQVVSFEEDALEAVIDGYRCRFRIVRDGDSVAITGGGRAWTVQELPRFPESAAAEIAGGCLAPMPGKVIKVLVQSGQSVEAGALLVVLEAMKMEHEIRAPESGEIEAVPVVEGDQVDTDQLLVKLADSTP